MVRDPGVQGLAVGYARGVKGEEKEEEEEDAGAGAEATSREKLSGAGREAQGERGAAVALSNKLDCLHEKAERLVRGPRRNSLSLSSLLPLSLPLLPSLVPAGYIPCRPSLSLSFLLDVGALRCI